MQALLVYKIYCTIFAIQNTSFFLTQKKETFSMQPLSPNITQQLQEQKKSICSRQKPNSQPLCTYIQAFYTHFSDFYTLFDCYSKKMKMDSPEKRGKIKTYGKVFKIQLEVFQHLADAKIPPTFFSRLSMLAISPKTL